ALTRRFRMNVAFRTAWFTYTTDQQPAGSPNPDNAAPRMIEELLIFIGRDSCQGTASAVPPFRAAISCHPERSKNFGNRSFCEVEGPAFQLESAMSLQGILTVRITSWERLFWP